MSAASEPEPRPTEATIQTRAAEATLRVRTTEAGKPADHPKAPEPKAPEPEALGEAVVKDERISTRRPTAKNRGGRRSGEAQKSGKARKSRRSRGKEGTTPGRSTADETEKLSASGSRVAVHPSLEVASNTFETTTITLPPDDVPTSALLHLAKDVAQTEALVLTTATSGSEDVLQPLTAPRVNTLQVSAVPSPDPTDVSEDALPLNDVPEISEDVPLIATEVPNAPHTSSNVPTDVPEVPSNDPSDALDSTDALDTDPTKATPDPLPVNGTPPPPPPYLPALTALTVLSVPFAIAGLLGSFIPFPAGPTARILAGCSVGFDLLLVLCGVGLAWRSAANRKGLWGLGIAPLLTGLAAIGGAEFLDAVNQATALVAGLATVGRGLAGIGTGTLTVYWLRANTGSVRPPAHGPSIPDRARTSRTTALLAFTGLILCGIRTDVLAATYLLPVELLSAWLVVSLVRAPHSPLTLLLNWLGRAMRRRRPTQVQERVPNVCVVRSGRVIDLDRIPSELRLLPLPRNAEQEEQRVGAGQTE